MDISLQALAQQVEGVVEGNGEARVNNIAPIESAGAGDLTFISNPKYLGYLARTEATAVLIGHDTEVPAGTSVNLVRVQDVYATFTQMLALYQQRTVKPRKQGIENPSYIDPSAEIGEEVYIGAFAYIGPGVRIGDRCQVFPHTYLGDEVQLSPDTILYSGAKLYAGTQVGHHCIIHSGAVIGSDGFGFASQADGHYEKIPQIGKVILGDHVEVGANTTIDRATMKATVIGEGVKLDNLIQIAHNVEIGRHTVIAAQAGVSGSTRVGPQCVIGGQAGFSGHIVVAERNSFAARSGLNKSIDQPGGQWFGAPVMPARQAFKVNAVFRNLPNLQSRVKALEQRLNSFFQDDEKKHEH